MTPKQETEEIVVPMELKEFLTDVVESKYGYEIGEPWKFSDKALLVVVPIKRKNAPNRPYTTMYEVLKDMGMKDTGHIDQVELQNKTGKAVFVRAGTIFAGETQNRAAQHSGVYQPGKVDVPVRCVHQTHGIRSGAPMIFGDIAPMSVTMNLMGGNQSDVWDSVSNYTSGGRHGGPMSNFCGFAMTQPQPSSLYGSSGWSRTHNRSSNYVSLSSLDGEGTAVHGLYTEREDDLLGHLQKVRESQGKQALDEMMQKVPLFENQAGAIIFNPLGVLAVETFDSPKSWEAIKQEVIEKYGDHVSNEQAEHLFELRKDMILPMLKKFLASMDKFEEKTIRKDDLSETRAVWGEGVVGEYTLVRGRTIHALLIRDVAG